MPFVEVESLELLLAGSTDPEQSEELVKTLHLKYGSKGKITSMLAKCGDNSVPKTTHRIFDEFKRQLLGITGRLDKTVSLEPDVVGRKPTKSKRTANEISCGISVEDSKTGKKSTTEVAFDADVEEVGGGVKERVFNCEHKWLILCFTLLCCGGSSGDAESLTRMRVEDGGNSKIQALVFSALQFHVSDRSIRKIHREFNDQLSRVLHGEMGEDEDIEITLALQFASAKVERSVVVVGVAVEVEEWLEVFVVVLVEAKKRDVG